MNSNQAAADDSPQPHLDCEGWWEQSGYGRQPMQRLRLRFAAGAISGTGVDIIGPFTFEGSMTADARVLMIKQYIGRHQVRYVGTYDGEGLLWGEWYIGPFTGPWLIRLRADAGSPSHEIESVAAAESSELVWLVQQPSAHCGF